MSWTNWIVLLFAANLIIFSGSANTSPAPASTEEIVAPAPASTKVEVAVTASPKYDEIKVNRVIDGDTIELSGGQKVRYIGIDTPELSDPRNLCYGAEAAEANRNLVEGKSVRLEKDISETDRYGRLLRYIWVGDTLVNDYLVRGGFAQASSYPPDVKYQNQFRQAEEEARSLGRGLWSSCSDGEYPQVTVTTSEAPSKIPPDSACPIKGNISSSGEKIYHLPGQRYYSATVIDPRVDERWFCTEDEAISSGWRKSKR